MTLKYISLFSGIEAVSCAWKGLDFECVALSEIDAFPCAVLQHRYPHTQNFGDITQITKEQLDEIKAKHGTIDIVVGGSPCQSFSLAGKRLGLEDARGNLMFEYCRIVETVRPKIFLWENVTGVLSSNGGKDFGCLLEYMAKLGYSLCWRTLDAKFFGVPQRRKRVFLVGCIGKTTRPFEILFEQQGSKRDLGKSKKEKQGDSTQVEKCIGEHDEITLLQNNQNHAGIIENATTCYTLTAAMGLGGGHVPMIVDAYNISFNDKNGTRKDRPNGGCYIYETIASNALTCSNVNQTHIVESFEYDIETQHSSTLCARDYKGVSSDDFSLNYQKLVLERFIETIPCGGVGDTKIVECIPLDLRNATRDADRENRTGLGIGKEGSPANTLTAGAVPGVFYVEQTPCDLYNTSVDNSGTTAALTTQSNATGSGPRLIETTETISPVIRVESRVRRLTPIECERLQGFPDNWTQIPYGKKSAQDCPDSPRYKALGNSMAVPVMRWIGLGILETENITTTTIMGIKK